MVSELQQQLKRIHNPEFIKGSGKGVNKGKQIPSILFDRKTAARNDLAAVFEIGKNGFKEVVLLDSRFLDFEDTFFSLDSLDTDRVLMNKEWNDQLDTQLTLFLNLLSKYFLMRPVTLIMEWLVRRFRINEFNVEQVLACILPYYETNEFLLVIRTLFFDSYPRWQWLVLVRKSECHLARNYFLRQLHSDSSLLKFICQSVQTYMDNNMGFTTLLNFYTTTLIEFLESKKKVDERTLIILIPAILHGLVSTSNEYNLCTYLILSQFGNQVTFTVHSLSQIISTLISNKHASKKHIILNLLSLAQSQSNFSTAITKCDLNFFLTETCLPYFTEISKKFNSEALLNSILLQLIEKSNFETLHRFLTTPGLDIPLKSLETTFLSLLKLVEKETQIEPITQFFSRLDGRYGSILEHAVSTFISSSNDTHVFRLIQQCLGTTVHAIVQDTGTSILLAIQHPNIEFSMAGVKQLETVLTDPPTSTMPQEDAKLVANALRDCLKQTSELQELILNSKVLMNFLLKLLPDASLETLLWLGTHCPSKHVIDALILALSSQYEKISKSLRSQLNLMLLHFFIIEKDWFDQNDFVKPELNSKSIQKLLSTDTFAKSGLEVINASNFSEFFNILLRFLNHSEKYFREKSIQLALLFSNEQQLDLVMLKVFSLADEEYSKYSKEFHSRFPSHDIFSFCSQGVQSPSSQVVIRCLTCLRSKMASTPKDYQSLLMFILPCFLNKDQKVRKAAKETLNQLLQALTHFDFESTPGNKWPAPFSPIGYSIDKIKFVKPTLLVKWLEHVLMIDLEASPANVCHFPFSKKFDTVLVAFLSHLIKLSLHLQHTWLVLLQPQCLSLTIITLHKHYRRLFSQLGSTPNRDSIDVILSFLKCIHPSMAHDIFKTPGVFDTLKLFLANYSVAEFEEVQLCTLKLIQTGFWVALSTDHQYELFNLLLTIVSKSKSSENVLEAKAALNRVPLAEALVGRFLTTFITLKQSQEEELTLEPSKKKPKLFVRSKHMSKLIALLELLKYKPYANYHVLVHPLFQALDLVLRLKPGTGSAQAHSIQHEFITQLILSDLLLAEMSTLNETVFRVELLVECLRSSDNPQTRNSALLVLSKIAPLCPDKVLLNIMPIFTFMGLHVSKQDDEFSFNTIESTIQSIVPSLSLDVVHVQQVIQVFVDTVMHIPVHRRLRLFATLVKTLGIEQLFMVILLLLEKNVHELFEFALLISSEFSEPMQLRAMIKLITLLNYQKQHLVTIPPVSVSPLPKKLVPSIMHSPPLTDASDLQSILQESEDDRSMFIDVLPPEETKALPLTAYFEAIDPNVWVKVKISVLHFVYENLTLRSFADAYIKAESATDAKTLIQVLFEFTQSYVSEKELLSVASKALTKIQTLLPIRDFVNVMRELWSHTSLEIVKKALRLFHERLSQLNATSVKKHRFIFLDSVTLICQTLERPTVNDEIVQLCFSLLQHLCMRYGAAHPEVFMKTIPILLSYFQGSYATHRGDVMASAYACFAHYLTKLQHHLISSFNVAMESSMTFFQSIHSHALHRLSVYVFWERSLQFLPTFMSPFLKSLISCLIDFPMSQNKLVTEKVSGLIKLIGEKIEPRLLLPSLYTYLSDLSQKKKTLNASSIFSDLEIGLLIELMHPVIQNLNKQDLVQYHDQIFHRFFLMLCDTPDGFPETLITDCFVPFVLRLNESFFKPLFCSLLAWSESNPSERFTVVFRLCQGLFASLRHLFLSYFITTFPLLPKAVTDAKAGAFGLAALASAFQNDPEQALRPYVKSTILPVLSSTLLTHPEATVKVLVSIGVNIPDDRHWKLLLQFILDRLHGRHSVQVKNTVLSSLGQLFETIGEAFLVYLPETVPALAECLDIEALEPVATLVMKQIEEVLGEPLQKYLQK